ncbi:MAG: cytochrome c oxidase subunit II [Euryarchaeota archaeon]|nr:cytochrome c oxidase subunit II [Euryarchaeota archaeon]
MGDAASTPIVDNLFRLYFTIGIILTLLVFFFLVYSAWRFRARGQEEPADAPRAGEVPPNRGHPYVVFGTVIVVGAILFGLSIGTLSSHQFLEHPPDDVSLVIDATGFQFGWMFEYPQGFQTFRELRVPANEAILLRITSPDVMHKFHVADYNIGIDAIPGRTNHLWFNATGPGVAEIRCAELCGIGHGQMVGSIAAIPRAEFDAWVQEQLATLPTPNFVQVFDLNVTREGPVPGQLQAVAGGEIHLRLTNNASTTLGFRLGGPYNVSVPSMAPNSAAWLNFSAPGPATATYEATNETGSRAGFSGTLRVLESQRVTVSLTEWKVTPSAKTVRLDQPVLFIVTNDGKIVHDLNVGGHWDADPDSRDIHAKTPDLAAGRGAALAYFPRAKGTLYLWCNLPGHSESGMLTTLEVV